MGLQGNQLTGYGPSKMVLPKLNSTGDHAGFWTASDQAN